VSESGRLAGDGSAVGRIADRRGTASTFIEDYLGQRRSPCAGSMLKALRAGDTLVVWKLDRLGRNLQHLVTTIDGLHKTGAGFRVLSGQGPALTPPRPQAS